MFEIIGNNESTGETWKAPFAKTNSLDEVRATVRQLNNETCEDNEWHIFYTYTSTS